jgi:hypothetical protein
MSKPIKLAIAFIALGASAILLWQYFRGGAGSESRSAPASWVCLSPDCRNEFRMSVGDVIRQAGPEGTVPCPKCGKSTTVRGVDCPNCNRILPPVGHGAAPETCPHCKATIGLPERQP